MYKVCHFTGLMKEFKERNYFIPYNSSHPQQWCIYVDKSEDINKSIKNKCIIVEYHDN